MRTTQPVITIRAAAPGDAAALISLAQLDSAPVPRGRLLTVWSDDRLVVALSRDDQSVIADPFVRTTHLVAMAREHAADLGARPAARERPPHASAPRDVRGPLARRPPPARRRSTATGRGCRE